MGLDADIARYLAELAQATQAVAPPTPPTLAALREATDAGLALTSADFNVIL